MFFFVAKAIFTKKLVFIVTTQAFRNNSFQDFLLEKDRQLGLSKVVLICFVKSLQGFF